MEAFYQAFYRVLQSIGYTHPVHPTLTYLPIGTVMAALIFVFLALMFRHRQFAVTARHCIVLGLVFVFPLALLGYIDWQYFYGGAWLFVFKMKITLAAVLAILLSITALLHLQKNLDSKVFLLMYALCFFTVVGLGYFGGEIVFGTPAKQENSQPAAEKEEKITFAGSIAGILNKSCVMCHTGDNPPLGLRLGGYKQVMAGSDNGPVVISGKPGESELLLRMRGTVEPSMPFRQPLLPDSTIRLIERWIEQGAPRGPAE